MLPGALAPPVGLGLQQPGLQQQRRARDASDESGTGRGVPRAGRDRTAIDMPCSVEPARLGFFGQQDLARLLGEEAPTAFDPRVFLSPWRALSVARNGGHPSKSPSDQ